MATDEQQYVKIPPWAGLAIGATFLLLTAWFLWGAAPLDLPRTELLTVDTTVLEPAPRRQATPDPPVIHIAGFDRTCRDCHALFPASRNPPKDLMQHQHIVLNHGINERCRNCHSRGDKNKLLLQDGTRISYSRVVELCSKCHGPVYRDWLTGAHGRTNGYWDVNQGEQRRLRCTECHDPHNPRHPAMDALVPLPPPRTLRMGDPGAHGDEPKYNPDDPLHNALLRTGRASGEHGHSHDADEAVAPAAGAGESH